MLILGSLYSHWNCSPNYVLAVVVSVSDFKKAANRGMWSNQILTVSQKLAFIRLLQSKIIRSPVLLYNHMQVWLGPEIQPDHLQYHDDQPILLLYIVYSALLFHYFCYCLNMLIIVFLILVICIFQVFQSCKQLICNNIYTASLQ